MPAGSGDRWPLDYERGRPGWPPEVVELSALPPAASVLDLGAGTGKLTRLLVRAFGHVVAVEPAEAMRQLLADHCPEAEVLEGTGQEIPLPDASADGVFAAQSFHWFDDDRALAEIRRVLRPAGAVVLLWNVPRGPTEPSIAEVERLLDQHAPKGDLGYDPLDLGGPTQAAGEWRAVLGSPPFEPLQEGRLLNVQVIDREGLVAFYASMGWIADLPEGQRLPLLDEARSLLTADEYRRHWETRVLWTRLTPG